MSELEQGAAPQQTFAQRKSAQLGQERAERGEVEPVTPMDPQGGTPSEDL